MALLAELRASLSTVCGPLTAVDHLGFVSAASRASRAIVDVFNNHPKNSNLMPLSLQELALCSALLDLVSIFAIEAFVAAEPYLEKVLRARFGRVAKTLQAMKADGDLWVRTAASTVRAKHDTAIMLQQGLTSISSVIFHPICDPRLVDKYAPACFAGALLLRRLSSSSLSVSSIGGLPPTADATATLARLHSELHPRVAAQALMILASGQFFATASSAGPSQSPIDPQAQPAWLRVSAASELGRLSMQAGGVEGILDAVFSSIDLENAVAVDRAMLHVAGILSRPPLEQCTADEYYQRLGPQLRGLLRLGGHNTHLLSSTAALVIANFLSDTHHWQAVWNDVLAPLLKPLLLYSDPGVEAVVEATLSDEPLTTSGSSSSLLHIGAPSAVAPVTIADEDAVMGCIEDLHKVFTCAPLTHTAAATMLRHTPALLDLYLAASANKLKSGTATACREVLATILSAERPQQACCVLLQMMHLSPSHQSVSDADSKLELRVRDPHVAFQLGSSAGVVLKHFPMPVDASGRTLAATGHDDAGVMLKLPGTASHRSDRKRGAALGYRGREATGLAGLFNIIGHDSGGPTGESSSPSGHDGGGGLRPSNQLMGANTTSDPRKHSAGLDGGQTIEGDRSWQARSASVANAIVDVLLDVNPKARKSAISSRGGTDGSAAVSASGLLFSNLLNRYSRSRLQTLQQASNNEFSSDESVRVMQLLIAMSERLGPSVLRSNAQVVEAVRGVMVLVVSALGLEVPEPHAVGCTAAAADIHFAHVAAEAPSVSPLAYAAARESEDVTELVSTCLGLLTVLMAGDMAEEDEAGAGTAARDSGGGSEPSAEDEARLHLWLRSCLPLLAALGQHPDQQASEMATALRAAILMMPDPEVNGSPSKAAPTRAQTTNAADGNAPPAAVKKPTTAALVKECMDLVLDPAPAVQANGIRNLARIIKSDPRDLKFRPSTSSDDGAPAVSQLPSSAQVAMSPQASTIMDVVLRQLENTDTYVFLAAIECLQAFASTYPAAVLPRLLKLYSGNAVSGTTHGSNAASSTATPTGGNPRISVRVRVKVGEVLTLAAQNAGSSGSLPAYAPPMLGALMHAGVAGWREQEKLVARLFAASGGHPLPKSTDDDADDSLAAIDANNAYNIGLELTDQADLRASAVSCLGEAAAYLGHALASHATDVIGGLSGILTMESRIKGADAPGLDAEAIRIAVEAASRVRRSAALALRRLVQGDHFGRSASVLRTLGSNMKQLYQLLQNVVGEDADPIVRGHANDALAAIDDAMSRYASALAGGHGLEAGAGAKAVAAMERSVSLPAASLSAMDTRIKYNA